MKRFFTSLFALILTACGGLHSGDGSLPHIAPGSGPTHTQPAARYTITDLGANFEPSRINRFGAIAGDINVDSHKTAALFSGGRLIVLSGLPGDTDSVATDVNSSGEVVGGSWHYPDGFTMAIQAVRFHPGAVATALAPHFGNNSFATAINDSGHIVGGTDSNPCAFVLVFDGSGSARIIGSGLAYAINSSGETVLAEFLTGGGGCSGYYTPAEYPPLRPLALPADSAGGHVFDIPTDINDHANVVGFYDVSDYESGPAVGQSGFLDRPGHAPVELGLSVLPNAINNDDQIVGHYFNTLEFGSSAFVWQSGTLTDLNTVLPANCGWTLTAATDITDSGQIVGTGSLGIEAHGFLLTPTR